MRGAQGLRFAFDPRLPAVRRFNAEDHFGGFRASGTQQAGEATSPGGPAGRTGRWFFTVAFKRRYRFIAQQGTARPLQGIVVQFATQHHFTSSICGSSRVSRQPTNVPLRSTVMRSLTA